VKCALASMGFLNGDVQYNKNIIIDTVKKHSQNADIVIFGEAFLQGFYSITFDCEHDMELAITQDDSIIWEICSIAKRYNTAISFGYSILACIY